MARRKVGQLCSVVLTALVACAACVALSPPSRRSGLAPLDLDFGCAFRAFSRPQSNYNDNAYCHPAKHHHRNRLYGTDLSAERRRLRPPSTLYGLFRAISSYFRRRPPFTSNSLLPSRATGCGERPRCRTANNASRRPSANSFCRSADNRPGWSWAAPLGSSPTAQPSCKSTT